MEETTRHFSGWGKSLANGQNPNVFLWLPFDRALLVPLGLPPHIPSGLSPGGMLSHLASHCCVVGGLRASAHSRDGWPVWLEQRTVRCCCPRPHCTEHCGASQMSYHPATPGLASIPQGCPPTSPHSPATQRAGGQRRKLQRMVAGGLAAGGQWAEGSVARWSALLQRTTRWRRPGPQLGVHCSWRRRFTLSGPSPLPHFPTHTGSGEDVAGLVGGEEGPANLGPVKGGPLRLAGGTCNYRGVHQWALSSQVLSCAAQGLGWAKVGRGG